MKLHFSGRAKNINKVIVGKVTRDINSIDNNSIFISTQSDLKLHFNCFPLALITEKEYYPTFLDIPTITSLKNINNINSGDILCVNIDGSVNILYQENSISNSLFVTEQCNSKCIMCSQPPRYDNNINYLLDINKKLIDLIPQNCKQLGITGGEPTLLGTNLNCLLKLLIDRLPDTEIHILSNARLFSNFEYTKTLLDLNSEKIVWGIPLYSDYFEIHDYIVQSKNAFYQAVLGIHNLARLNQRIEIRTILHKLTLPRLSQLAKFIYKNLTFTEHIAFMGLENMGFASKNFESLWINPLDYCNEIEEAITFLHINGFDVSIYNIPLCLLSKELQKFSARSISEWKTSYLTECQYCRMRDQCSGLFESNLNISKNIIQPYYENQIIPSYYNEF